KNLARYIDQIKERNVWVYGAAGEAYNQAKDIDWDRDVALVIGSEGSGMRRLIRDKCDDTIKIPLRGKIDSLNASVAAGILINEIVSKREEK
ncbi:MAG TPA: 23S rRNA (guanosine(2251)-2'-O)-methyltransferase RlmB, partial [Trueperaceae bacterium]|nr:23S rRNA (guanosine(2251)-2'-O)-methyltransferase RlmB [Trueperaceae bacterium]